MLKKSTFLALFLSFAFTCNPGFAEEKADDATAELRKTLEQFIPGAKPDSITPTPIAGLYEVVFGPQLFYMTGDGRYVLQGNLIDFQARTDISEPRRAAVRVQAVNDIGEKNMVVFAPKGAAKHTITVFTDPDCPYCRKLHNEMAEYNRQGIKVRYLLFPRAGKGSVTYDKSVSIWCAKDRNDAMTQVKSGNEIEKKTCDTPIEMHMEMGEMLGITGTPTIVLDDGRILPGYVPADRIARIIEEKR